jgi:hypothetical protein
METAMEKTSIDIEVTGHLNAYFSKVAQHMVNR